VVFQDYHWYHQGSWPVCGYLSWLSSCVNLCLLLLVTYNFIIFELSFYGMSCVET
jgi:hypothetical protein